MGIVVKGWAEGIAGRPGAVVGQRCCHFGRSSI